MKIPKIPLKAMKAKALGTKSHELKIEKLQEDMSKRVYIAQLKYDGIRLILTITNGVVLFRTFNGSIVPLPKKAQQVRESGLDNIMIDAEITIQGGRMGTRPKVSGMINSAMHGGRINEDLLSINLFDSMYIEDFNNTRCITPYDARYNDTCIHGLKLNMPVARNDIVKDTDHAIAISEQLFKDGFEGLVLKPRTHLYTFTRHRHWVKIKETKPVDLKCVGTTPGEGKYEGMIGALMCEGMAEDRFVKVNPASGMSDLDRSMPPSYYINKTIQVLYNTIIQDQRTGEWSLFSPRFDGVRIDK